jgi:hypothetical protein
MFSLTVRNASKGLLEGIWLLRSSGVDEQSRNGPVRVHPTPVATTYTHPLERLVSVGPQDIRDANHVFHLMEAIWMFAGENSVDFLLQFNSKFDRYAEPNGKLHGAYGHRWQHHFGQTQLYPLINELRTPGTRRAVLAMWDPVRDLNEEKRDLPCNTHAYFQVIDGGLNMTVCCRSNDIVWGAYGANAVHFSMLQELVAHELGVPVGQYVQFSNNYHLYTEMEPAKTLYNTAFGSELDYPPTIPLLVEGERLGKFLADARDLVAGFTGEYRTQFFRTVAKPLHDAYLARKRGEIYEHLLADTPECDWSVMFRRWCARRDAK